MPLTYVGAHYSLCPVEVRELWTAVFDSPNGRRELAERANQMLSRECKGVVPLFTCNRFDMILHGLPDEAVLVQFFSEITHLALERHAGSDLQHAARQTASSPAAMRQILRINQGKDALAMLFRIASSLDSLVLGEPHILGQLKEQFLIARDLEICGPSLESFFARSFAVAKKVRTETDLGRNGVSIGHAAVLLASRIFEKLNRHKVLMIGAGEMGRLTAQHLLVQGVETLSVANRTFVRSEELIRELGSGTAVPLQQVLDGLHKYDIIIIATSARHFLITPQHFRSLDRERKGQPMVVVDISVPRNVDPACAACSESLFLFDVDDLDKIMEQNREQRKEAARHAERLIEDDLAHFCYQQARRSELEAVGALHKWVHSCVKNELEKGIRKGHKLESGHPSIDIIAQAVAKKLVSNPVGLARAGHLLHSATVGEALRELFDLQQIHTPTRHPKGRSCK
jgi:glutamyl-tRNA reductase